MPRKASSKRYAQGVFGLALERGLLDQWANDLGVINEALRSPELKAFLDHAKVPLSRKVRTIDEVAPGVDQLMRNLLSLLVSRGIVELFPDVCDEYQRLLDEYKGRDQVEVVSAVPLESGERERLARFLTQVVQKEVVLETKVEPLILGGLLIKVGDRLIDGSTRSRLSELRKRLQRDTAVAGI